MADFMFTKAKADLMKKLIDFVNDDIRMLLVMTNTTIDTQEDIATFADVTTLDEFDGSGYTSPGVAMTTEAVQQDDVNNRGEFHSDNVAFGALGAGTRQIQAYVIYKFNTTLADSQPLIYSDSAPQLPLTANGAPVTVNKPAEGWLQTT